MHPHMVFSDEEGAEEKGTSPALRQYTINSGEEKHCLVLPKAHTAI